MLRASEGTLTSNWGRGAEGNGLVVNVFVDFGLRSSYIWVDWTGQDKAFRNGKVSTKPFCRYSLCQVISLYVAKALLLVEQTIGFCCLTLAVQPQQPVVKIKCPI